MGFLYVINSKGTATLRTESTKLCPELAFLSEKELIYVILAHDNYGPYRQFPSEERIRRAKAHVFGSNNSDIDKQPKIIKASKLYQALQYDPRREQIKSYERKLKEMDYILDKTANMELKDVKAVISTSKEIRAAIREIEVELYKEEEEEINELEGEMKLSYLEKMQRNVNRYLEVTKKKVTAVK